ncbi:hypothetical protein, partial [Klebsiella variicola]
FYLGIRGKEDLYRQRKTVLSEDEEYKNAFSVLTPEEYKNKFNEAVNQIAFIQHIKYGHSVLHFIIPVMPAGNQLAISVKKITYMDGSEEIKDRETDDTFRLNTQKTVKNID